MNRWNLVTLVSVVAVSVNLSAASLTGVDQAIEHGDRTREYRLYVPSGLDGERPAPLVFALHGGGGKAAREEGRVPYNKFAERDGWIVVYPNGIDGRWNDLRGYEGFVSQRENVDDVGLIETILRKLNSEFSVDEKRVFVTGASNGGLMSHTLAAKLADRIAAIAPIVGSMARPISKEFRPSRPVSVLMINNKGDPAVLWDGGEGGRANFVSMPEAISKWKQANGCGDEQTVSAEAIPGEAADARVSHTVWSGCAGGVNLELYVVEANRHGHPRGILDTKNGRGVYEVIWDFFGRSDRK